MLKASLRFRESEVDGDHVVLLVTDRVSDDYLAHLQKTGVSYLFCGKQEVNLHVALRKLGSAFRLRKLMLQGGGKFNGAMLKAGLVDEISQITVPVVDGGCWHFEASSTFPVTRRPEPLPPSASCRANDCQAA